MSASSSSVETRKTSLVAVVPEARAPSSLPIFFCVVARMQRRMALSNLLGRRTTLKPCWPCSWASPRCAKHRRCVDAFQGVLRSLSSFQPVSGRPNCCELFATPKVTLAHCRQLLFIQRRCKSKIIHQRWREQIRLTSNHTRTHSLAGHHHFQNEILFFQ